VYLSNKGINFTEFDVASDAEARQTMFEKSGRMAVPTILMGKEIIIGFDAQAIEKYLH